MSRRGRRIGFGILLAVVALAAVGLAGVGWYYSGMILGPDKPTSLEEQRVIAAWPDRIELSRDRESLEPGRWALQWRDGYGLLGPVIEARDSSVVREFRPIAGTPPVGHLASIKGVSRSADPRTMWGLDYQEVSVAGPLGAYPAWFVPGVDSTWVIYTHGRGANQAEALRALEVMHARGLPSLLISYRNDVGAPPSADHRFHLGQDEWPDLEAAVHYALDHGARDVVLVGFSMGGQIVMQFMTNSKLAPSVRAVQLESPVLNWSATLDYQAGHMGVPTFFTRLGERVATRRAGLDFGSLDRVAHARGITAPVLLFHNVPDHETPIWVSESLATALPATVTFVRIPTGNHVEAWNADHDGYCATINAWYTERGIGTTPVTAN